MLSTIKDLLIKRPDQLKKVSRNPVTAKNILKTILDLPETKLVYNKPISSQQTTGKQPLESIKTGFQIEMTDLATELSTGKHDTLVQYDTERKTLRDQMLQ